MSRASRRRAISQPILDFDDSSELAPSPRSDNGSGAGWQEPDPFADPAVDYPAPGTPPGIVADARGSFVVPPPPEILLVPPRAAPAEPPATVPPAPLAPPVGGPPEEERHRRSPLEVSPKGPPPLLQDSEVQEGFGKSLRDLVDLRDWKNRADPAGLFDEVGKQARVATVLARERYPQLRRALEEEVPNAPNAPPYAGVHFASRQQLEVVARGWLYPGRVEAVHGGFVIHQTVPMSIAQAGVCVVGYSGRLTQWHQRMVRRDFTITETDPRAAVQELLEQRDRLERPGLPHRVKRLSELARRGIVGYMERLVMLSECPAGWRMGSGHPVPLELLTGMGHMELLEMSVDLLRRLLLGDSRWVWVIRSAGEGAFDELLQTLDPYEFAVLIRLTSRLREQVEIGNYPAFHKKMVLDFVEEVGPHLVLGAYRAGELSPPRYFIAHEDHVCQAALIAMADAMALPPSGLPPLLEIARASCHAALGGDGSFEKMVEQAYRDAGQPEWQLRARREALE